MTAFGYLVGHSPGRNVRPRLQRLCRPIRWLVRMTDDAGVWNLKRFRSHWSYELESMSPNVHVGDGLLNLGHMADGALVASAPCLMMRVRFDARRMRTVG